MTKEVISRESRVFCLDCQALLASEVAGVLLFLFILQPKRDGLIVF